MPPSDFDECLRRAALWVREQEQHALHFGLPLSERESRVARQAKVARVEMVRLLAVSAMPTPLDPVLREAMRATGFGLGDAHGLALGHAILLWREPSTSAPSELWRDEGLIGHELVHVAQVERLGLDEFLRQYLEQCLSVGYDAAPLERAARRFRFDTEKP